MEGEGAPVRQYLQIQREVGRRQQTGGLLRPFHQADIAPVEFIAEPRRFPLFRIAETVQIEVAQV